jgi:hypothetical protein
MPRQKRRPLSNYLAIRLFYRLIMAIETEQHLVGVLKTCGFDFLSTAGEIAARFPKEPEWGVGPYDVLPFRLGQGFAGFGEIWKIPLSRDVEIDLPPTMYVHEFHPTDDTKANFEQAEKQLTALLGPGRPIHAANAYERDWQVGFFTIRVVAWPRALNTQFHNVFEGRNPYLWIEAKVYIQPEFPFIVPSEDPSQPIESVLGPSPGYTLVCDSPVYARRNLTAGPKAIMLGLQHGALVSRAEARSVRIPLDDIRSVVLTRLTPGRSSGSSMMAVSAVYLGRHRVAVKLADGEATASLDDAARRLATALAKPLTVEQYADD